MSCVYEVDDRLERVHGERAAQAVARDVLVAYARRRLGCVVEVLVDSRELEQFAIDSSDM